MVASTAPANPFLSTVKAADAVPAVLHPLVLLSISDHITRHTLRKQPGPVVGALLGQQNGRQVTIEHTFDFVVSKNDGGDASFSAVWFNDRVEQMKTVHKDRHLDLVGWYTVLGHSGPTAQVMQVHEQILPLCSESTAAVLLAFHPEDLAEPSVGGKLPLTLYETHYEQDETISGQEDDNEDKEMADASTAKASTAPQLAIKLREITYTVETDEAEMISIDFVARGAANASATRDASASASTAATATSAAEDSSKDAASSSSSPNNNRDRAVAIESGNRGKRRLVAAPGTPSLTPTSSSLNEPQAPAPGATAASAATNDSNLSPEEEELIATLTTRANAIRMLHARLELLTNYLASLPQDALSRAGAGAKAVSEDPNAAGVSLPILRSIQALVQRLPLVVPPPVAGAFEEERRREANDVRLVSLLLDDMMQSIASARQVGDKFGVVETARASSRQQNRLAGQPTDFSARGGGAGSGSLDALL
ncbi:cop9 signalosome subunit 6 [Sporothrix brasiliensis 5110]|uniref:COP9 signalosome complex subunit 6 n=1 Tax=Sporothrix brasiliensis 5110 TaxID=1398154 RepID=A0A0C2IV64_9PEZI|nr:cop9 signalosome subunit 6 [Sporothrix brasiliensis 5110]KIH88887.1 cop9 signalosome subunit 6 [Sporothrix brasiliensis 5110]